MKKFSTVGLVFTALGILLFTHQAFAVTASPSALPTTSDLKQKQIDEIKERVATKVAQLRQSEKRAMFGTVKSTSLSSMTVETAAKDIKIELSDSIAVAQMIKGKRTKLTTEDLAKGDIVTIFGDYDTTLDILTAKAIYIQSPLPTLINGTVTAQSAKDFTVTITAENGQAYVIDIEKVTKTLSWSKEKGIVKIGFSALTIGDSIHVVGTIDAKDANRVSALRILTVGNLTGAAGPPPTPTLTPTPTKIVTPTVTPKTTLKATIKPTPSDTPAP